MKPSEIQALVTFAQVGLRLVSERLLSLVGMVICAVLFGWVMWSPDLTRLAGASLFALIVYLPLVRYEREKQKEQTQGGES